jgi:prepilin-type N-terminal cleavage/methylation domain-containing protein
MNPRCPTRPTRPAGRTLQRGFTLVEMAVVLALLGVLTAISFKSQELVEQYRQSQFVSSVRVLQAHLNAYKTTYGRWPGDCNRDGLMDHAFLSPDVLTYDLYDYGMPTSLTAAANASTTYTLGLLCPSSTLAPFEPINVPFNELKWGGHTPSGEPNRKAASHTLGGFAYLGTFNINPGINNSEDRFNAIVLTEVPIVAARRLAVALDGSDGSAANLNRVRRSNDLMSFEPLWTAADETELKRITVVVFFDRIPPT